MSDIVALYLPFALGLALTGAASGVMAGLLGIGGGIIMVPAMVLAYQLLGYNPEVIMHVAVGTSLAVIVPTGLRSALAHRRRGAVEVSVLRLWGPWIVAASLIGGLMAGLYSAAALKIIFGVMALFIALNMALPVQRRLMEKLAGVPMANRIAGAVIGYISALMGIGGGSLSVPTLVAFGTPVHKAVGTSSALGVMLAIPAVLGFVVSGWTARGTPPLSLGFINIPSLVLIGGLATLTAPLGVAIAHRLNGQALRVVFAVFLVVVGARMLFQAIWG
ncbi:sulfite exporter TauE/SafE family protein [Pelagibacterium xiamenense]|uniref:sulfite exporter TauE/SafE family protein n=1 Tax=Pelagibacterium xiamenense TaxID=2901140 RepID=UPI001E4B64F1|nr:sulfite exporter TauE/SafE family protein [Pelagibacterium xiamenense]MCD7060213.1 sulfite exporter TauE/SafE family protein [Pelagibacterium xiamenense]